ncbi:MAG: tRNA epoxyqueuosine(34) reductase QueG [Gallionella sp.]
MQNSIPRPINYEALAAQIRTWAHELGFQSVGITDTDLSGAETGLQEWLARGFHGEMDYMATHGQKRTRPEDLLPGTSRVISLCMNYSASDALDSWRVLEDGNLAFVSRYALGRDYHKVLRKRLEILAEKIGAAAVSFNGRVFTDSAPIMEVELARKAGIGWRGKHTLLLSRELGSMFFLGEIFVNIPIPVDFPKADHCGSCARCIDVCPTQAIIAPYRLDARLCISYLTIELRGSIPIDLRSLMGNRIYGCDDCQLVCPWNRFSRKSIEPDFAIRNGLDNSTLAELFAWSESEFEARHSGSAIHRIGYVQWLRNIAVALGNAPTSDKVMVALRHRAGHASEIVREHVEWAILRHSNR